MSTRTTTLSTGGTVTYASGQGGIALIILDHPDAPADMRNLEVGRVVEGGFQPAPFLAAGMRPETLRAIADLIDGADR